MTSSLIAVLIGAVALFVVARDFRRVDLPFTVASRIARAAPFAAFAALSLFVAPRASRGRHPFQFDLGLSATDIARSAMKLPHLRGYAVLFLLAVVALGVNRLVSALLACTTLGIACELAQATVVGHNARLADLAPNLVGCLVALLLVVAVRALVSTQRRPRVAAGSSGHGP